MIDSDEEAEAEAAVPPLSVKEPQSQLKVQKEIQKREEIGSSYAEEKDGEEGEPEKESKTKELPTLKTIDGNPEEEYVLQVLGEPY